jgi:hypothetical protein
MIFEMRATARALAMVMTDRFLDFTLGSSEISPAKLSMVLRDFGRMRSSRSQNELVGHTARC